MNRWFTQTGPYAETAFASFVTLTRNLEGLPFPVRLNLQQKVALEERIAGAAAACGSFTAVRPDRLYPYEAAALAEQSVISPEFAAAKNGALLLRSQTEELSLMLCDEDHVRILAAAPGLDPEGAYAPAARCEEALDRALRFAFDPQLGYLNQDPTNIGTGLSVSALLHLPGLAKSGALPYITSTAAKLGLTIKGAFGDGINMRGDLFRIGNALTMGLSEEQAISNLKSLCLQLATRERAAAEQAVQTLETQDKIRRAAALLEHAVLLNTDEAMELLSLVRMGALYLELPFKLADLNELFVTVQPASVNCAAGEKLPREQRDALRAKIVKEKLFG